MINIRESVLRYNLKPRVESDLPGRLRILLPRYTLLPESIRPYAHYAEDALKLLPGVHAVRINARIGTVLVCYDPAVCTTLQVFGWIDTVVDTGIKIAREVELSGIREEGFSMAPAGGLALALIGLDGFMKLTGAQLAGVSGWLSTGATLAAVVEHGYQELQLRGSFDPEVMSIIYLINSIGKTNTFQASLLAWIATFGRHLVPKAPREQVFLVRPGNRSTTLIP